jgi:hypothetical protein
VCRPSAKEKRCGWFNAHDFSGISANPTYISFVTHQAVIQVDETGSEAAGATGVGDRATITGVISPQAAFDANHPFIFAIVDHSTGTMLFMGSVTDPGNDTAAPLPPVNPTPPTNPIPVNLPPISQIPTPPANPVATPAIPAGPGGSIAAVAPVAHSTSAALFNPAVTPSVAQGVIQAAAPSNRASDVLGTGTNKPNSILD